MDPIMNICIHLPVLLADLIRSVSIWPTQRASFDFVGDRVPRSEGPLQRGTHVAYTTLDGNDDGAGVTLTFSFVSPYAPTWGYASALDDYSWTDGGSSGTAGGNGLDLGVAVPNTPASTPDGGLTAALMGGAILGLGALRRKLGC